MLTNLELLQIMINNPEELVDKHYSGAKENIVITESKSETNRLMYSNANVLRFIDTYKTNLTFIYECSYYN
jgi:hypothetical protein